MDLPSGRSYRKSLQSQTTAKARCHPFFTPLGLGICRSEWPCPPGPGRRPHAVEGQARETLWRRLPRWGPPLLLLGQPGLVAELCLGPAKLRTLLGRGPPMTKGVAGDKVGDSADGHVHSRRGASWNAGPGTAPSNGTGLKAHQPRRWDERPRMSVSAGS